MICPALPLIFSGLNALTRPMVEKNLTFPKGMRDGRMPKAVATLPMARQPISAAFRVPSRSPQPMSGGLIGPTGGDGEAGQILAGQHASGLDAMGDGPDLASGLRKLRKPQPAIVRQSIRRSLR